MANTEVILREHIKGLGSEADVVKVRTGYARNFLIPQGKAFEATSGNLRHIEALKAIRATREAEERNAADRVASKLKRIKFNLELNTGESGKAFGAITVSDIAKAILDQTGETIDRHQIQLAQPIKGTGNFDIPVRLHSEVTFELRLRVVAAGADVPEEETAEGS